MKRTTFVTTVSSLLTMISMNSFADVYTVSIELDNRINETLLTATETQAMNYPILGVTDATKLSATCRADGVPNSTGYNGQAATEVNSLCPNVKGLPSNVKFSDVKGAVLTVNYSVPIQNKGGISFSVDGRDYAKVENHTLSTTDGTTTVSLNSFVRLTDKSLVTDGLLDFTYEISAAYQ